MAYMIVAIPSIALVVRASVAPLGAYSFKPVWRMSFSAARYLAILAFRVDQHAPKWSSSCSPTQEYRFCSNLFSQSINRFRLTTVVGQRME
jgi:hypothetical protein